MHFNCNVECTECGTRWPTNSAFLTEISGRFRLTQWFGWCTFCGKSQEVRLMDQDEKLDNAIFMPHMDFGITLP